uniref:Uncharacterized protein n=1 Tax=Rhizophora mucronata TaxID=61149 RepID=A0A2P2PRH3_RHIMU
MNANQNFLNLQKAQVSKYQKQVVTCSQLILSPLDNFLFIHLTFL